MWVVLGVICRTVLGAGGRSWVKFGFRGSNLRLDASPLTDVGEICRPRWRNDRIRVRTSAGVGAGETTLARCGEEDHDDMRDGDN